MNASLFKMLEHSSNAYIQYDCDENKIIGINRLAATFFGDDISKININDIFPDVASIISDATEQLKTSDIVHFYNIVSNLVSNNTLLFDLDVGNFDNNINHIYFRIKPCLCEKEVLIKSFLEMSHKIHFLVEADQLLTITYANSYFYTALGLDFDTLKDKYDNKLSNLFDQELRDEYLTTISKGIENQTEIIIDVKFSIDDQEYWFYFEIQPYKTLDGKPKFYGVMLSIDKRIEVVKELETERKVLDAAQELSSDILFNININDKTLMHRNNLGSFFGLPPVLNNFPDSIVQLGLIHHEDIDNYLNYANNMMNGLGGTHQMRIKTEASTYDWFELTSKIIFDNQRQPVEVLGKLHNISERKRLEEAATHDMLTDTLNKIAFIQSVELHLKEDSETNCALFFIDIDNFKLVNDTHGHAFGDALLENIGHKLNHSVRNEDLVGRVGGDEFVLCVKCIPNDEILLRKAEQIITKLSEDFESDGKSHNTLISIGIASFPKDAQDFDNLYKKADKALYYSKRNGKNMSTLYTDDL